MIDGFFALRSKAVVVSVSALTYVAALLTATPAAAQADPSSGVGNCDVELSADEARLSWDGGAESFVVFRQVEGRDQFWRGRTNESTFVDAGPTNFGFVQYRVAPRSNGTLGEPVDCVPTGGAVPITRCEVRRASATDDLGFLPGLDEQATYAVFRSQNGDPFQLAGRYIKDPFGDFFGPVLGEALPGTDEAADAQYAISVTNLRGEVSPVVFCTQRATIDAVAYCTAVIRDDGATVTWERPSYDEQIYVDPFYNDFISVGYVIRRSVNDGMTFWRGRVDTNDTSVDFLDSQRAGQTSYSVQTITPRDALNRSESTTCDTVDERST